MNTYRRARVILATSAAALLAIPAMAEDFIKLQNTTSLNLSGAWDGGGDADGIPDADDILIWNNVYTAPGAASTLSQLGGDLSVFGLRVTDVGGTVNATNTMVGFRNTSSANTLTIGAGGIDMSAARQALDIQSKILLGADQTWTVTNANTSGSPQGFNNNEDLGFFAQALATMDFGGFTATTTGTGQITITSGYTLQNGTLNIGNNLIVIQGGSNRLTTIASTLTTRIASGATLRLQSNSGALAANGAINLDGGTLNVYVNNSTNGVTINGDINVLAPSTITVTSASTATAVHNGNITGSAELTINNTTGNAARPLQLAGDNSGYTGAISINGTAASIVRLNTATAGSAAATWSVGPDMTLQTNGVSVDLGTLNGSGIINNATGSGTINVGAGEFSGTIIDGTGTMALTKNTSGTLRLSGVNTYTGATTVNAGTLVVGPGVLTGTTVSVASGATLVAEAATSGTLDVPSISLADDAAMVVRPLAPGAQTTVPLLTIGSATGGTVTIDTTALGNPTAAPLIANTFAPAAGTEIVVLGANLTPGIFPVISYTTLGGGGFGGLSLQLPFRVSGNLVNNTSSIDVNITATAKPVWTGTLSGNWDIDTAGDGSTGTANWTATSGPNTYVETASLGADSVVFDDTGAARPTVTLTTVVSPGGIDANHSIDYTFSGSGRITGKGVLVKSNSGTLTIANTGTNDFTGGVTINGGKVRIGDGATSGAGTIGDGPVTVNPDGTIELNRPDDFTLANVISGAGSLIKSQPNIATLAGTTDLGGAVNIAAGTLRFTSGGNLSGALSGSGSLSVEGGTLQLSGTDANTLGGTTTISAGTLQLNKTGVDAIGGTITVTGTGNITFSQPHQIADTATVIYDKATNAGTLTFSQLETIGALTILNGHDSNAQVIFNGTGSAVTGLATIKNTGVLSIASNASASVGGLNLSETAIVRIAANSNPSTLNVGASGITASGGTIQVGQGTGAFDAVLNLEGDVTTTGDLAFTDGNYFGPNLRQINIGAANRTFNIGAGTTTTIAPDIAGTGGITKTGAGTLRLTAASASTYSGPTVVSEGTFLTTPFQFSDGPISVGAATFGVNLEFAGTTFFTPSLSTSAGSVLQLATGALGNPSEPVISAGTFTVGGPTAISLTGTAFTAGTGIPLISYTSLAGSGLAGLSLGDLPVRVAGSLVNNTALSRIEVNLTAEQVKWSGAVDSSWDIDPDGTGATGTANWRTTVNNSNTRYFEGTIGTDTTNFDDSATNRTVNLTTSLSPIAANVDNTQPYTFTGSGKLTGATILNKSGTGTLILANTTAYDHTGGTIINAGVLQVGDGVTPGAGLLPTTAVTNNASIVLNRPDDFSVGTAINGTGTLTKLGANMVNFSTARNYDGPIVIGEGTLRFDGGGTLNGSISGSGSLVANGGTLQLAGFEANTNTSMTTVSEGVLQLGKPEGVNAVGGDITITGTGRLSLLVGEQIPDDASIQFLGSSTDSLLTTGVETVRNVLVNSVSAGSAGGQFIMRNGFTIAGVATLQSGILGTASSHSASVNEIRITATDTTSAILRIAASAGASTLNVGAGGITASGGTIEVKFNQNDQDGILNLGGDFTATGDVNITNANYTGASLNVINLTDTRTFDIAAGTTTTVAPDIAGPGGLRKTGGGTLLLTALSAATHAGDTVVEAGTLAIAGSISGTPSLTVKQLATLDVSANGLLLGTGLTLRGDGNILGNITLGDSAKLAPGDGLGTLNFNGNLDLSLAVANPGSAALAFELGAPGSSDKVAFTSGALTIGTGVLAFDDFAFTLGGGFAMGEYTLFDGIAAIFGTLDPNAANLTGSLGGGFFGTLELRDGGSDLALVVVPEPGSAVLVLSGVAGLLGFRRRRR